MLRNTTENNTAENTAENAQQITENNIPNIYNIDNINYNNINSEVLDYEKINQQKNKQKIDSRTDRRTANSENIETNWNNEGTIRGATQRLRVNEYETDIGKVKTYGDTVPSKSSSETYNIVKNAKSANPFGAFVDLHEEADYKKSKNFSLSDGSGNITVKEDVERSLVYYNDKPVDIDGVHGEEYMLYTDHEKYNNLKYNEIQDGNTNTKDIRKSLSAKGKNIALSHANNEQTLYNSNGSESDTNETIFNSRIRGNRDAKREFTNQTGKEVNTGISTRDVSEGFK